MSEPNSGTPSEPSKSALKKAAKEAKKAEAKAKRAEKVVEKTDQSATNEGPTGLGEFFGTLSQTGNDSRVSVKEVTDVGDLDPSKDGKVVRLIARLHTSRAKGNLCFLVLRQQSSTVQAIIAKSEHISKAFIKFAQGLVRESVLEIEGVVKKVDIKIDSTTQQDVEIEVKRLFIISSADPLQPLLLEDAGRPQALIDAQEKEIADINAKIAEINEKLEKEDNAELKKQMDELLKQKASAAKYVVPDQSTKLDNRCLDLRTPANQAIFRLQSGVCQLFREFLSARGFIEIHSPKMISAASEGGASVFKIIYFDRNAYLAQSPQFYKQMAICADFGKVFEIGPVFRAENANTYRHLTEFTGLDLEMSFVDHYYEVLDLIEAMFLYIFEGIETRFQKELATIQAQYPFVPIVYHKGKGQNPRLQFPEAVKLLREAGIDQPELEDLSTINEKALGRIVKEKFGTDFYTLDKFPTSARPFYTMLSPEDPV